MQPGSDVYSLGCTLYYAVTGKVPFPGGTSRDKARRHCEETPLNPRRFNLELSDDFVDVIAAMMEKNPHKRIQSATDVIKRLAPWAKESIATAADDLGSPAPSGSAALRPFLPSLSDTQPGLFDEIAGSHDESPSQVSQRTDPVASAENETLPDLDPAPELIPPEADFPLTLTLVVVVPLLLAAVLLVGSIVIKALQ